MTPTTHSEGQLFVKSFFADSVEETLDRARIELGPDALLLEEHITSPENRHLGTFEVIFGVRAAGSLPLTSPSGDKIAALQETLRGMLARAGKEHVAEEHRPQSKAPS